jgi:hypothetical protein
MLLTLVGLALTASLLRTERFVDRLLSRGRQSTV